MGSAGDETHRLLAADPASERLCLLVLGRGWSAAHPLPSHGKVCIGRATDSDIAITDPSVSRRHAILDLGPPLRVVDAGSANGIVVRGRRLMDGEAFAIEPGEVVEIGSVVLVVHRGSAILSPALDGRGEPLGPSPTMPPPSSGSVEWRGVEGEPIVVRDPVMIRVLDLAARVAPSSVSVLLLGETGVGKEVVAETIHRLSPRSEQPFVRLSCAALAPTLLETELFGHERGAFTGAVRAKEGLLESAAGGTVFLDEIGELPMELQVKLLRVLEEREVTRVGALEPKAIDVRFVAATNRNLVGEIERGAFRQDLYFRLDGISIIVPPLRERVSEIEPMARAFLARACAREGRARVPELTSDAVAVLLAHRWPGNVRELEHVIERALLLCESGDIGVEHLASIRSGDASPTETGPPSAPEEERKKSLHRELDAIERKRIADALEACAGNQTRAAKLLGVSRRTIVKWIRKYDLPRPRKPSE